MPACSDCKHWGDKGWIPGWHVCNKMTGDGGEPVNPPTLAVANEVGEAFARVITASSFGCVMFERREM